ncbi:hypothetical protein GGR53DRAFT_418304 [Hypoxylon sp. FL1150]|nr:hypothetical protein GGR53DRAFT_418304 [Hypoxylon sp. FL1150]
MHRIVFMLLTFLHFCRLSSCAALAVASTTAPTAADSTPSPTPTPPVLGSLEAKNRADSLCGYYDGDAARPFICSNGQDCLHNDDYNAVGCVAVDGSSTSGAVFTTCIDYAGVMNGFCTSDGPRTGCCQNSVYPYCIVNTYTGSVFEGYTMVWCAQEPTGGALLAWYASTSDVSVTITATDTETPAAGQIQSPSPSTTTPTTTTTPTPTPTDGSQGLSLSDRIALGTALGIGLPATIAGIIAAWKAC